MRVEQKLHQENINLFRRLADALGGEVVLKDSVPTWEHKGLQIIRFGNGKLRAFYCGARIEFASIPILVNFVEAL